jgi:hypothetical protein
MGTMFIRTYIFLIIVITGDPYVIWLKSFRSETDSNISVVTGNDPGKPPSFDSNHMRTSDIVDASDTVGQDFDHDDQLQSQYKSLDQRQQLALQRCPRFFY